MKKSKYYRYYEMIPGLLTWTTLIGVVLLSFLYPIAAIYLVIVFDFYWLLRVLYFVFFLFISWRRYRATIDVDWYGKLKNEFPEYKKKYHIIFYPFYTEPFEVISHTFEELIKINYDLKRVIVVLGGEERAKETAQVIGQRIKQKYAHHFHKFIFTMHPANLPDEIKGKGANSHYMGHRVKELVDGWGTPYEDIIVSNFDSDTITHPQYFAYLTYRFLTVRNPYRTSFQPVALYNNNIWESNPITRIAAFGTTFWLLSELARPDRLYTFSSHSMSWKALVDVGFWQKDLVTEDSRIFLQCFFRYDGQYQTATMYIPVSMDTVDADTVWQSLKNLYKQQRRWAWGVEHFPYLLENFVHNKKISFSKKFKYIWNLGEGMYSWATAPLIIFLLGRLPFYVIEKSDGYNSVLVQNTPFVLQWILSFAMVGIFASILLSLLLLPPFPSDKRRFYHWSVMVFQWALLPVSLIFFGSLPAIDAQTRLMIHKPLGFFNTPKKR